MIKTLNALEIIDSRGNPTVEVTATLSSGATGRASVPSGASTGCHEAIEWRDKDPKRFGGKGVLGAVNHVNHDIQQALVGKPVDTLADIDRRLIDLDGTPNKQRLGANALLGVSLAVAKAVAADRQQTFYDYLSQVFYTESDTIPPIVLPVPMINILNGGAHANNSIDIQEFMILPVGAACFSEGLRWSVEVFHVLRGLLIQQGLSTNVGDEGGFAPDMSSTKAVLDTIMQAIEQAGYKPGQDICLGLDVASSEFYTQGDYHLRGENQHLSSHALVDYLDQWVKQYPILSIEDGMAEDDWEGWSQLTEVLGERVQLVGDDLFVTHTRLLQKGIDSKVANAILIKPNQIGTLTETLDAVRLAQKAGYGVVISHRSGETEDTSLVDIALATQAGQIKTGGLSRTDRIAKYNQLLRTEATLMRQGVKPLYPGFSAFPHSVS